jgi:multidrug efflux pump subunit AcrB
LSVACIGFTPASALTISVGFVVDDAIVMIENLTTGDGAAALDPG